MAAFINELCTEDDLQRAIILAFGNDFATVFQAWVPLLLWKQTEMPKAFKGTVYTACLYASIIITVLITLTFIYRDKHKNENKTATTDEEMNGNDSSSKFIEDT